MADWLTLTRPVLAANADGRLEIFVRAPDLALWHAWQLAPNDRWSSWASLGGRWPGGASIARNADGRLELMLRGEDGNLWHAWQLVPNGNWSSWVALGGSWPGEPSLAENGDGRLEVFARGWDGHLYHNWQLSPGGNWSGWASLPSAGTVGDPVAVANADGHLEVFWVRLAGQLFHTWQDPASGGWSDPESLGGQWPGQPAIGRNADGRLEVFLRGQDGRLYHASQDPARSQWSGWSSLGGQWPGDPAVGGNADGRLEVFLRGEDRQLYHRWQTTPNDGWSGWASLGGQWEEDPAVASNEDGRLDVLVRRRDGQVLHNWQSAPNNDWSSWAAIYSEDLTEYLDSPSHTPPSTVMPIPGPDHPFGEPNWVPLQVPGTRTFHRLVALTQGGPLRTDERLIEIRGWITGIVSECDRNDRDWNYGLELDPEWLDGLGCPLNAILRVGNVIDHVDGTKLINDLPRIIVDVPSIHVENAPWGAQRPWPLPNDWTGAGSCPDFIYAFDPRQPVPWCAPLQRGDYVRMVGELITDIPHDDKHWCDGPCDGPGAGGPARWTELHPVDLIERLPDKPRTELTYGAAVWADNGVFSGDERTLDVDLPFPHAWTQTGSVEVEELILPGTNVATIVEGNANRTGAAISVHEEAAHVHVKVRGEGGWGVPGKYAALYRVRYRPASAPPSITITPRVASVLPGQSVLFGVRPAVPVDWRIIESVGSLDPTGRYVAPADPGPGHLVTVAAVAQGQVPYPGGFATATVWVGPI